MPLAVWLNQICDEFHCLPSQAWQEWVDAPVGFLEELVEARNYEQAKAIYSRLNAPNVDPVERARVMSQPIMQLVRDVDLDLAREAMDAKRAAEDG